MNIWKQYKKIVDKLSYIGAMIGGISLFLMMLLITVYIVVRKTIGVGGLDTTEISGYLMVIAIFLGMAYTFKTGGFIKIEFLYDRCSGTVKKVLDIILGVLALGFAYLMTRYSIYLVMTSFVSGVRSNSTYRVLLYYPQMVIVIGSVLLLLVVIEYFGDKMIELFKPNRIEEKKEGGESV